MTAPAPVAKLGFHEVRTPDVDRLAHYYTDALQLAESERDGTTAYLSTGPEHHCVVLTEGEADGRARLGFELAAPLADVAQALDAAGVAAQRRTDPEPGIAEALVIEEAVTSTPIWLYEDQASTGQPATPGTRPTKLGHIASYSPDLAAQQAFYQDVLGFRWSDTIGDFFAFLRCNSDHHSVNIMQSQKRSGLFHVAYEMRDFMHLKDALDHLAAREIRLQWGPGRHGAGHNVFTYHPDPDGNYVELFCELDQILDERTGEFEPRPWHETFPQVPQFWSLGPGAANKWGPIDPEMMEH
jgi:catechol-2,3-dioxygenase